MRPARARRDRHRLRTWRGAVAAACAVLTLAACSGKPAHRKASKPTATSTTTTTVPGVTDSQIVIGTHQPVTGADSPGVDEIAPATAAFFDYVNAHGGIYGRAVVDKIADDASDPGQASEVVRQLVLNDGVFAIVGGLGTATHAATEAFLNAEHVPDLFAGSGCTCWNDPAHFPWTFGWQTDYTIEGKVLGGYVSQLAKNRTAAAAAAAAAAAKVAYVYEDDPDGQQGVAGLDREVDPSLVVARLSYNRANATSADADSVVAQLQAAGAQTVVVFAGPRLAALTLIAAANVSYHPTWVIDAAGADPTTLTALLESFGAGGRDAYGPGASPAAIEEGIVSDTDLPVPSDISNPWISLFRKIHDADIPNLPFDANVVDGMSVAATFYSAMEAAGPHPTRSKVVQAVETADLNGPNLAPFGYSSNSRSGMTGSQIVVDTGGAMLPNGPVYVTDDKGGGVSVDSGAPVPPPAALTGS